MPGNPKANLDLLATIILDLVALIIGLAVIACGVYLALRPAEKIKTDKLARRLGLHHAPRSYWALCVVFGIIFSGFGVMKLMTALNGAPGVPAWWAAIVIAFWITGFILKLRSTE